MYVRDVLEPTIDQLRAEALDAGDADGYFAAMYARVTDRVDIAITDGRFADGERMARFARGFADWYLGPRHGTRALPDCWRAAQDVTSDGSLLIVQHLLLGINAHVNHDLPQVVVELAGAERPLDGIRPDFDAINDILAETQGDVLRDLGRVSGWTQWAVALGGGRVFNFSLDGARGQAWATAQRLHDLDAAERPRAAEELDEVVSVLAYVVTQPSRLTRWLLRVPRWLEDDDPTEVTRKLLGHLV